MPCTRFYGNKYGNVAKFHGLLGNRTLQELLAPQNVQFFSCQFECIGSKISLADPLSAATGIEAGVLKGQKHPYDVSIYERLSWAARRRTTREEDQSYCLLGLFNVSMPLLFGEGAAAWPRLIRQIAKQPSNLPSFAMPAHQILFHVHLNIVGLEITILEPSYAWSIKDNTGLVSGQAGSIQSITMASKLGTHTFSFGACYRSSNEGPAGWIEPTKRFIAPVSNPILHLEPTNFGHSDHAQRTAISEETCIDTGDGNSLHASMAEIKEMSLTGVRVFSLLIQVRGKSNPEPNNTYFPSPRAGLPLPSKPGQATSTVSLLGDKDITRSITAASDHSVKSWMAKFSKVKDGSSSSSSTGSKQLI